MQRFINRVENVSIPGYPAWFAALLYARGADTPEKARAFLAPGPEMLSDPLLLPGVLAARALLREAVAANARVAVYGDYDTDGICAAAILTEALERLGARVFAYIPEREAEGYGLNTGAVRALAPRADILITVDCGITAVAEVALARELGMKVIVTDHHTVPDTLPDADAVVSPLLGGYPSPYLCGAGIAYKLAQVLRDNGDADEFLDFAALATVADMVPLTGENRVIAAMGLKALSHSRRPGIVALKQAAGIQGDVTAETVAFMLAPRLNAGGRLASAMNAYALLTTLNVSRAEELAAALNALNDKRRQEEKDVLLEAEKQVSGMDLYSGRVMVVSGVGWNAGVVGLAAGKLAEKYGYPAVAFSVMGDACVGSARSAGGIDIYAALKECEDLFLRFGGHRQAAGMTLKPGCLDAFAARFNAAVLAQLNGRELVPEIKYDGSLELRDVSPDTIALLNKLEPCGMGNPSPLFLVSGAVPLRARGVGAGNAHLKLTLSQSGVFRDAIAFGMGDAAGALSGCVDALFQPTINAYNGRITAECRLKAIRSCAEPFLRDKDAETADFLQELTADNANEGNYVCALSDVPEEMLAGAQGTLLLCRAAVTGNLLKARFPQTDTAVGTCGDARAYHAICLRHAPGAAPAPYRNVVLCDGQMTPAETALLRRAYPLARIYRLPLSAPMLQFLAECRLEKETLRACYRSVRDRKLTVLPEEPRLFCAVHALRQLSLVTISGEDVKPLPVRPRDPMDSPLFRFLSTAVPM
jgi:single-stranded-DNA-specific exonuclease